MITSLDQLPALTRSWLAPLEETDPELYAELAESVIIDRAKHPFDERVLGGLHPDVASVLNQIDLTGKQIGEFYFAPESASPDAAAALEAYQKKVRNLFDIEGDVLFIGKYGEAWLVATPGGLAALDRDGKEASLSLLARDFTSFIIAQANAYDAFRRLIAKSKDEVAYRAASAACAALPSLQKTADVEQIFYRQLKS